MDVFISVNVDFKSGLCIGLSKKNCLTVVSVKRFKIVIVYKKKIIIFFFILFSINFKKSIVIISIGIITKIMYLSCNIGLIV